jgi:hypothetical protein
MNDSTQDSPEERDIKAYNIEAERIRKAERLAWEFKLFKWECRAYFALVLLVIFIR